MDEIEQDIFLDIACFFKGFSKKYVMDILDSCDLNPIYGIQKLFDKCLISVDQYDKLSMNDFLQQMGKDIVRRESPQLPGKRSRLWRYEDVLDVLTENTVYIILFHFSNGICSDYFFHLSVEENLSLLSLVFVKIFCCYSYYCAM